VVPPPLGEPLWGEIRWGKTTGGSFLSGGNLVCRMGPLFTTVGGHQLFVTFVYPWQHFCGDIVDEDTEKPTTKGFTGEYIIPPQVGPEFWRLFGDRHYFGRNTETPLSRPVGCCQKARLTPFNEG